jgi:haloalkane dehalogenase
MFAEHRALARSWPHQEHVMMCGSHLVPWDCPDEIGTAVAGWLRDLP